MSTLPTPRTDAAAKQIGSIAARWKNRDIGAQLFSDLCEQQFDHLRSLERELAEAKAERDALKAALAIGQENCDAEYNRLRDERDEMTKVAQGACKAEGEALKREDRWRALAEELAGALEVHRKAYIPDGHNAPEDCFATGPMTDDPFQDLIACPGCRAEALSIKALTRFRDAANPASARTPPGTNERSGDE